MSAAASEPKRLMTFEEWADLPEDETGEWVDGELVEEEMPTLLHELVVAWLIEALGAWARARKAIVVGSGLKFRPTRLRGRLPDAAVFVKNARRVPRRGVVEVPPDVMVEVVSGTPRDQRRDRIDKLQEYAAFGVAAYWLVDPEMKTFEALELGADGRYVHAAAASEGTVESPPGCPGLTLHLDELWARLDAAGIEPEALPSEPEALPSEPEDHPAKDERAPSSSPG